MNPIPIFFPQVVRAAQKVKQHKPLFAYYTQADTAYKILSKGEIWMRNAMGMNDYMEVNYGFQCLHAAFRMDGGKALVAALDCCFPDMARVVETAFTSLAGDIARETYLTCLSQHFQSEDSYGRLSMWRAYGGKAGVALVIDGTLLVEESVPVGTHLDALPVEYINEAGMSAQLQEVADQINANLDLVKSLGHERLFQWLLHMLRVAAVCTKHPGFSEEREWRIIAQPDWQKSPILHSDIELVRGLPQKVVKVKLENRPELMLDKFALPELLYRVIVGPCDFPWMVQQAIRETLELAGVANVESKLQVSDIPLRHV